MSESVTAGVPGVSLRRSAVFAALAVALFAAGGALDLEPGAQLLPLLLLLMVALVTAVQSATNGSPALGLVLSVAPALGFWLLHLAPDRLLSGAGTTVLQVGLAASLLVGLTGHLAGAQFATLDPDRYPQQSTRTQLLLAVPLLLAALWWVMSGIV